MLDNIGQIPAHAARMFQDKEALVFEGRSFPFNELNELIEKFAGGLHGLGIGQGLGELALRDLHVLVGTVNVGELEPHETDSSTLALFLDFGLGHWRGPPWRIG